MDPRGRWRAPELGTPREVGPVRVFESGSGPPVVLLHGLFVNANLWRKVVPLLARDFRCVTLNLPLGSHELPMPAGADLSPPAMANLVADTIADLGLDDVTLVGNDTGGALCQILVGRRPQHVGRLVLTSCDYRDTFPPAMFSYFKPAARLPGAIRGLLLPMRLRLPRRLPIAFGWLAKRPIDRPAEDNPKRLAELIADFARDPAGP